MKRLYFAGDLFDHKHLTGNHLLAAYIQEQDPEVEVLLPQQFEQSTNRALDIRNQDYKLLLYSDLVVVNFDGTDLDSGTVAEFMFAKALDIPTVIFRTDFRAAGDGIKDGDPWNLMLTGFPRTHNTIINSMSLYQANLGAEDLIKEVYSTYALHILKAFKQLKTEPIVYPLNNLFAVYKASCISLGNSFIDFLLKDYPGMLLDEVIALIVADKVKKGVY